MSVVFLESKRGKKMIVFNKYKYNFGSENITTGLIRWRCIKRICSTKIYTTTDGVTSALDSIQHDHTPSNENEINRQIVSTPCKRKAIEDAHTYSKKIILKELSQNSSFIDNFINDDINKIRNVIYDSRRKVLPVIHKNIIEAHLALENTDVITCKGEKFLVLNDQIKNIVIFSCDTNLKMLCEVDSIYVDGTFKCCARFWTQMFTIHGSKNGNYIPLVIYLLPDKITETYSYVFNQIINKCNRIGQTFLPKRVVIDFEIFIHIAVTEVWPSSHIIGCRFHLTQS